MIHREAQGPGSGTDPQTRNLDDMTPNRDRTALTGFATLVLFTVLAGDAWRNSLSWYGYGAVAGLCLVAATVLLVRARPRIRIGKLPIPLIAFLLLATASIAWSFYPGVSAAGVGIQWATTVGALFLTLCISWREFVTALAGALRIILGLSVLFELVVGLVVRHPVFPLFTDYGGQDVPDAFYWSRNELLEGGRIQGILGNSNLLAMIALYGVIVFGVQLASGARRRSGYAWLALAVLVLALTRSSTVLAAALVTVVVLGLALLARRISARARVVLGLGVVAGAAGVSAAVTAASAPILEFLGKSSDLTGRFDIWAAVSELALQKPVVGWGWISYWAPWVDPFTDLALRGGVRYLQAHNAYLDVWFQLGLIGLAIFLCLIVSTTARAWWAAIDRPQREAGSPLPFQALDLLPLLIVAALLTQSLAESRILLEGGWVLLAVLAIATKLGTVRSESAGAVESRSMSLRG